VTFRGRLTLLAGGAVAIAIVLASVLGYLAVRSQLRSEVDNSLRGRVVSGMPINVGGDFGYGGRLGRGNRPGDADAYQTVISASGARQTSAGDLHIPLPITRTLKQVASGKREVALYDTHVDGVHVRVITAQAVDPAGNRYGVALGRSLAEVDSVMRRLRLIFLLAGGAGIALAMGLGWLVARRATAPLARLTEAARHVADTRDLAGRIKASGHDEIASLATTFNEMLDALEKSVEELDASVRAQRQLVADASHELRTPITSLRTNIEILRSPRGAELGEERRSELLDTVVAQTEELSVLMNDVIELARGDQPSAGREPLRMDEIVEEALERTARHAPDTRFEADLQETTVVGVSGRLTRAVNNLLDNAVKWNAPGEPVEVTLRDGMLRVRDHGPGIPEDELPHVFDRFFRGAQSRAQSGSGLGLAIVRQVAEDHGGSVSAARAQGGGAVFELRLPVVRRERAADAPVAVA
jgi:two-component system sensor histidine kinase MprB